MTDPATLADQHDQEALAYELAAEKEVTQGYVAATSVAVAGVLAVGSALALGTITVAVARDAIHRLIGGLTPAMAAPLLRQVTKGYGLGRAQAFQTLGKKWRPFVSATADPDLREAVTGIDRTTQAILDEADRLADLLDLEEESNVLTVASKVTSSGKHAQATTRWSANRALNAGISDVAKANGARLLWSAERNACLKCLAYSGLSVVPGALFPVGLTLGTGKSTLGGIPYPPLHRYCRCRVVPYTGPAASPFGGDLASGLKREAARTVARGWSDYASQPERLRAADLLLKRGAALPKTVLARASRDVKRGSFSQRHRPRTTLNA